MMISNGIQMSQLTRVFRKAPQLHRYKVDLVYHCKKTLVPLIFVEVKLELGEGGNPFWQNHQLYQSYTKENMQSHRNGAPIFFVQLCGMSILPNNGFQISNVSPPGTNLGIGGGFYDTINNNMYYPHHHHQ